MPASILWYDLETFGLDARYDRIAQFACIRTDENLEETEAPVVLYCRPGSDYLPSPQSCLVHGITPQHADAEGLTEYRFALRIHAEMTRPETTVAGFNSVRFDDEFIRHLFYRNLMDPYEREWARGNSRWDAIDLVRAAHDLRPEGIVWPRSEDGRPLFKLEALAKANGIALTAAHDALHDIRATIGVARLVKTRQPRLYAWYYGHRTRERLKPLVDLSSARMLLHTAAEYTRPEGCSTLIAPLALDPQNRNQVLAIDLRFDPEPIASLDVEALRARIFSKASAAGAEQDGTAPAEPRLRLPRIRLNHCPFLAPARTLRREAAQRLGLDLAACERHMEFLARTPGLVRKLVAVFDTGPAPEVSEDPEFLLYSGGFLPDTDRDRMAELHRMIAVEGPARAKRALPGHGFEDPRLPRLAGRFFARNFPDTLSDGETARWRDYCAQRIQLPSREGAAELSDYDRFIADRLADPAVPARDRHILHALQAWKAALEKEVLSYGT